MRGGSEEKKDKSTTDNKSSDQKIIRERSIDTIKLDQTERVDDAGLPFSYEAKHHFCLRREHGQCV